MTSKTQAASDPSTQINLTAVKRIILIDPSIISLTGHYLTYAATVISAAERRGLDTVVATHRSLEPAARNHLEHAGAKQVIPVFHHEHWIRVADFRGAYAVDRISKRLFDGSRMITPAAWKTRWERWRTREFWSSRPIRQLIECFVGICFLLVAWPLVICEFLLPARWRPGQIYTRFLDHAQQWQQTRCLEWCTRAKQQRFCDDLQQLHASVRLCPGDLVFVPTLSLDDIIGLSDWLNSTDAAGIQWHLVCRYELKSDYRRSRFAERLWSDGLTRLLRAGERQRICFWTDTDELSAQYTKLGCAPFGTLPIPHTLQIGHESSAVTWPLTAVSLGDARREKGYPLLPDLVRGSRARGLSPEVLQFTLQSNVHRNNQDPSVLKARDQLSELPGVDLITRELSSFDYEKLLLRGDIALLLYDPAQYAARSSGVLVEALTAGMPALVRDKSWLSAQLEPGIAAHQSTLYAQARKRPADPRITNLTDIRHSSHQNLRYSFEVATSDQALVLRYDQEPATAGCSTLLSATFYDERGVATGIFRRAFEVCRDITILIMLPSQAALIELSFDNSGIDCVDLLRDMTWELISWPGRQHGELPMGAAGVICSDVQDAVEGIAELVKHYEHYQRTARLLAKTLLEFHNPDSLINALLAEQSPKDASPC